MMFSKAIIEIRIQKKPYLQIPPSSDDGEVLCHFLEAAPEGRSNTELGIDEVEGNTWQETLFLSGK